MSQFYDPNNEYTIPYGAGIPLIVYDPALTDVEIKGYGDLWNPALEDNVALTANYRVINGNHEYGYEILGLEPPLRILERKMRAKGKRFTFYDTYMVDFIIATYDRLRKFKKNGGLWVRYNGKKYPIRFFQCGHLHHRQEVYDGSTKIFITQPGSFVKNEMVYAPGILVRGRVLDNKTVIRE